MCLRDGFRWVLGEQLVLGALGDRGVSVLSHL